MDRGRPNRCSRCETIDAGSGAASGRHASTGGRALSTAREPLPTRVEDAPDLPFEYRHALETGLDHLGLHLDHVARAAIDGHMRLLLAWTPFINLTGIRDPSAVALGHVIDSLSAVDVLRELGLTRFIDLGSGGGVPGIPLAAALPAEEALLVEPIGKKARFLETVVAATGLVGRVRVAAMRAEALAADPAERDRWSAVVARAVAPLPELVELAFPLLERGGVLVAWKRGDLAAERSYADRAMRSLGGGDRREIALDVPGLAGHRLVVLTRTGRVPPGYPRDPAVRRRRGP